MTAFDQEIDQALMLRQSRLTAEGAIALEEAGKLYRGSFMADFFVHHPLPSNSGCWWNESTCACSL